MTLIALAKSELLRANADRKHPFRTFSLGTFGAYPEIRTVVKRKTYEDLSTLFFTDSRSPKILEIRQNPKVSALFYHPRKKLQVRLKGEAQICPPEEAEYQDFLNRIKQSPALKDYTTAQAPGAPISGPEVALFDETIHFAAVKIKAQELDILQLGDQAHERMLYVWELGAWRESRLVP